MGDLEKKDILKDILRRLLLMHIQHSCNWLGSLFYQAEKIANGFTDAVGAVIGSCLCSNLYGQVRNKDPPPCLSHPQCHNFSPWMNVRPSQLLPNTWVFPCRFMSLYILISIISLSFELRFIFFVAFFQHFGRWEIQSVFNSGRWAGSKSHETVCLSSFCLIA